MAQVEHNTAPEATSASLVQPTEEVAKKGHLPEIPIAEVAHISCHDDLLKVLALHDQWTRAVLDPHVEVAVGRANLKDADLRGYDLSGVNLSGANLSGANLAGCDLEGANLTVANLEKAVLATCNLRHAKMRRARLDGADLRGADLTGAVLTGVDLSKALIKTPEEISAAKAATAVAVSQPAVDPEFKLEQQTVPSTAPSIQAEPQLPPGVVF